MYEYTHGIASVMHNNLDWNFSREVSVAAVFWLPDASFASQTPAAAARKSWYALFRASTILSIGTIFTCRHGCPKKNIGTKYNT